jgi:hypothetical protein
MDKREKILVAIMGVALLYGAYVYLFEGSGPRRFNMSMVDKDKLQQSIDQATQAIAREKATPLEQYRTLLALQEWEADPMLDSSVLQTGESAATGEGASFDLQGVLIMGGKRLAVINGVEYEEGEDLEAPGYVLAAVRESKVVIRQTNATSAVPRTIVVPMREEFMNLFQGQE